MSVLRACHARVAGAAAPELVHEMAYEMVHEIVHEIVHESLAYITTHSRAESTVLSSHPTRSA
ncbi:MAG: hypothetical protein RL591_1574 [Planctomycetota bacterium]